MFTEYGVNIYYNVGGSGRTAQSDNEDLSFNVVKTDNSFKLTLNALKEIELVHAEIIVPYAFAESARVMPNGYQSWTETREYTADEKYMGIRSPIKYTALGRKLAGLFGDYYFKDYPEKEGVSHGYTYAYIRNGDEYELIGSRTEKNGFTIFNFDMKGGLITIEKDTDGLTVSGEYELYDLVGFKGGHDEVFDKYFAEMGIEKPRVEHSCGYTSWYNYFGKINEEIILRDLDGAGKVGDKIDFFQIDDGYQSAVGDWEVCNQKFPRGMKFLADAIHEKGYKAGLWLAPFNCQRSSKIAKLHPEWLVRDEKGKPFLGGIGWGGAYVLDFYIKECADYIKQFFNTVLNDWGYDMVKLDFLYSICLVPRNNKTRGQIMCEAMDFLRECVGDKLILGCGVPLGPAFGKVDFCRIGSDVDLYFKPRWLFKHVQREVVSAQTAIKNAIFRRGLNNRAFVNDPDVFFMRNINLHFTLDEKLLLAEVNKTFGGLLFVSDNIGDFDGEQLKYLNDAYDKTAREILSANYLGKDEVEIVYAENGEKTKWTINWLTGKSLKETL